MANPDFPLAPWEVPPGSNIPLVAPADHVYRIAWINPLTPLLAREIVGLHGEKRYFVREIPSEAVGNWAVTRHGGHSVRDLYGVLDAHKHNRYRSLGRRFFFDGARFGCPGTHELFIGHQGAELLTNKPKNKDFWPIEGYMDGRFANHGLELDEFIERRAASIGRWARQQMEWPDSLLGSALRWVNLPLRQQQSLYFGLSCQEIALFQTLMRAVLWTQTTLWEARHRDEHELENRPFRWRIATNRCLTVGKDYSNPDDQLLEHEEYRMVSWNYVIPPRLRLWREVLCRGFRFVPPAPERFESWPILATGDYAGAVRSLNGLGMAVEVGRPTHHELIESLAQLRDWCATFATPAEFATLMREDEPHLNRVEIVLNW